MEQFATLCDKSPAKCALSTYNKFGRKLIVIRDKLFIAVHYRPSFCEVSSVQSFNH